MSLGTPSPSGASALGVASALPRLNVISWNVAGFARTHEHIKTHYGNMDVFLERHSADVFCIQETRVKSTCLSQLDNSNALGANCVNYESFWAFNEHKAAGGCGVAMWVRKDLAQHAQATQRVLQDDMDLEGRCLLVDLGALAVFNVYVPLNANKLRFLELLKRKVKEVQEKKMVLVCGDLNCTWRTCDSSSLLVEVVDNCLAGDPRWRLKRLHASGWIRLKDALKSLEAGVEPSESEVEELAQTGRSWHSLNEPNCVELLRSFLETLCDTFVECHAEAEKRFTHWKQEANLRYCNTGSRLDYILCDKRLFKSLMMSPASALAGATEKIPGHSAEAAWNAATNFGRWHGAHQVQRHDGGGLNLQQDHMKLNDSQFRAPHTGMLYTPPKYSDHVPVCACFEGVEMRLVKVERLETRKTKPWASQETLDAFFHNKKPKTG